MTPDSVIYFTTGGSILLTWMFNVGGGGAGQAGNRLGWELGSTFAELLASVCYCM